MVPTRIDLSQETREKSIVLLNARLADAADLQFQAKQAHWNVKGSDFIALHKLFDEVYAAVGEYVDIIAERAVALGGTAYGTVRVAAEKSTLAEYPLNIKDGKKHVAALADALAAFGKSVRAAIEQTEDFGDVSTGDVFTEVSRGIDKWLWFVEAHIQNVEDAGQGGLSEAAG